MIPLVLAFARRIWMRSGPRVTTVDFDSSPRLQRMEQAIESIAIEVEREAAKKKKKKKKKKKTWPHGRRPPPRKH